MRMPVPWLSHNHSAHAHKGGVTQSTHQNTGGDALSWGQAHLLHAAGCVFTLPCSDHNLYIQVKHAVEDTTAKAEDIGSAADSKGHEVCCWHMTS